MVFEVWLQRRQCHTPRSCTLVKKKDITYINTHETKETCDTAKLRSQTQAEEIEISRLQNSHGMKYPP